MSEWYDCMFYNRRALGTEKMYNANFIYTHIHNSQYKKYIILLRIDPKLNWNLETKLLISIVIIVSNIVSWKTTENSPKTILNLTS